MTDCKIRILGAEWEILFRYEADDLYLKEIGGYTDYTIRQIVVCRYPEPPDYKQCQNQQYLTKKLLRHEIVHAFLVECGLAYCTGKAESWATNEEMIDWIAFQHEKLHKAFEEAGAL